MAVEMIGGPRLCASRCSPLAYCVTEFSRLFVVRHKYTEEGMAINMSSPLVLFLPWSQYFRPYAPSSRFP